MKHSFFYNINTKTRKFFSLLFFVIILTFANESYAENTEKQKLNSISSSKTSDSEDELEFENFESSNQLEIKDPYEKINRFTYAFNDAFDRYFFEYVARSYRLVLPSFGRKMVRNFLNNLSLPISAINSFAQGKVDNGLATFSNFLINSTIGIAGIIDVAGKKNIIYSPEDFGQTIGSYGISSGSYLMIPFLGPSTTRDFFGSAVEKAANPLGFNLLKVGGKIDLLDGSYRVALSGLSSVDTRESLLDIISDIRQESFDPYATIRSAYIQKRSNQIKF